MHKDIPVVDIVIAEDIGIIEKIGTVYHAAHMPLGVEITTRKSLNEWWMERSIPASRDGLRQALINLDMSSTATLPLKCHGLSLSDQYWIRPQHLNLTWNEINFFENDFSRDVGEILFGRVPIGMDFSSPDNTSDGWLKKRWIIADGKRMLMKGGSGVYQQEPLNELIACMIMQRLEIPHVPYTLTFEDRKPYSLCETFVTPETELVSAYRVMKTQPWAQDDSIYTHLLHCAGNLGIPNVPLAIAQMLVVDYIIANTDRHRSNFGFVRNTETLEWYGLAPLYDSGTSLWHDTKLVGTPPDSKPFEGTHEEQIKLVHDFSWFDVDALKGIGDECAKILSKSEFIDEHRSITIGRAVEERAKAVERIKRHQF